MSATLDQLYHNALILQARLEELLELQINTLRGYLQQHGNAIRKGPADLEAIRLMPQVTRLYNTQTRLCAQLARQIERPAKTAAPHDAPEAVKPSTYRTPAVASARTAANAAATASAQTPPANTPPASAAPASHSPATGTASPPVYPNGMPSSPNPALAPHPLAMPKGHPPQAHLPSPNQPWNPAPIVGPRKRPGY